MVKGSGLASHYLHSLIVLHMRELRERYRVLGVPRIFSGLTREKSFGLFLHTHLLVHYPLAAYYISAIGGGGEKEED